MTTIDTDALTERIARILNDEGWTFEGIHEPGEYDECEECRLTVAPIAARVAREVAEEVCKAKAEALRETADWWAANPDDDAFETDRDTRNWLRDVATEYEAGDSDEHR